MRQRYSDARRLSTTSQHAKIVDKAIAFGRQRPQKKGGRLAFADRIRSTKLEPNNKAQLNILMLGGPGSGKTHQISTLKGTPLVLSAEGGLLTLRKQDIAAVGVTCIEDLKDAYVFVRDGLSAGDFEFDWLCLDSITEIAEVVLASEKAKTKDPRQAYGAVIDVMMQLLRDFRDLEINLYCTGQLERVKDEAAGVQLFNLAMPGSKLGGKVPYLFDEVFVLHSYTEKDSKKIDRAMQTQRDERYEAKDRSGVLEAFEEADLGAVIEKIRNN